MGSWVLNFEMINPSSGKSFLSDFIGVKFELIYRPLTTSYIGTMTQVLYRTLITLIRLKFTQHFVINNSKWFNF